MIDSNEINHVGSIFPLAPLTKALCKAQSEMSGAKKNKVNPYFKSNYSTLSSVFEALKEPFGDNGLSVSQTMDILPNGRTVLETTIFHESGCFINSKMLLPDINDPQKMGSAITYFRRYSLMAIAGIPAEDDDGNSACEAVKKESKVIDDETLSKLIGFIGDDEILKCYLLKLCSCDELRNIKEKQMSAVRNFVKKYKESQKLRESIINNSEKTADIEIKGKK